MRSDPLTREGPQASIRRRWVMAQLFGLSLEQVARICPLFPKEAGG